jgi:hypothetical protein
LLERILKDSLTTGSLLSATTTVAVLAASANENRGSWGAVNSISHIVDGDDVTYGDEFSFRGSSIGVGINATAMVVWAIIHRVLFGKVKFPGSLATAAALTAGAYVIDYHIVPKQFSPGIEKKISRNAIYCIYAIMALTVSCFPFLYEKDKK